MFFQVKSGPGGKLIICNYLLIGFLATVHKTLGAQKNGNSHYITAIEDNTTRPTGFMVMTADHNYAIYSPRLVEFNWTSVTVNNDRVFITTTGNRTLASGLFDLNEHQRDFLAEVRGEFTQNLAGLKLSRNAASDSLFLLSARHIKNAAHLPGAKLSFAEQVVQLADSMNQMAFNDLQEPNEGQQDGSKLLASNKTQARSHRLDARGLEKFRKEARSYQMGRKQQVAKQSARYGTFAYSQPKPKQQQAALNQGPCWRKPANLNYYNLFNSQLASSLCGDIYNFDMRCQVLDVYSKSISIQQQFGSSFLYRDELYFAYSRSDLPLHINRFFLVGANVFFVYQDRSLLLKHDWLLDPLELDLVTRAQRELQVASNWRTKQAKASSSELADQQQTSQPTADNERAGRDKQASQADQTTTQPTTSDEMAVELNNGRRSGSSGII